MNFLHRVIKLSHTVLKTVLKASFRETAPKGFNYRDYNKLNADDFTTEFKKNLATNSGNYENFEQPFLGLLDKHVPFKNKKIGETV